MDWNLTNDMKLQSEKFKREPPGVCTDIFLSRISNVSLIDVFFLICTQLLLHISIFMSFCPSTVCLMLGRSWMHRWRLSKIRRQITYESIKIGWAKYEISFAWVSKDGFVNACTCVLGSTFSNGSLDHKYIDEYLCINTQVKR